MILPQLDMSQVDQKALGMRGREGGREGIESRLCGLALALWHAHTLLHIACLYYSGSIRKWISELNTKSYKYHL